MILDFSTKLGGSITHATPLTMVGTYMYGHDINDLQLTPAQITQSNYSVDIGAGPSYLYAQMYADNVEVIYRS